MCGSAGVIGCNPNVWYSYLGNSTSDFVPFQINYKKYPSDVKKVGNFTVINPMIKRCDESVDGIKPPCSCMDCSLSYIRSSSFKSTPQELIFGLSPYTFLMICVFLIGSFAFLIISSFRNDKEGELI
jgi:Niemann-Pick C1 protein